MGRVNFAFEEGQGSPLRPVWKPSEDQITAIEEIREWISAGDTQEFRLGGLAGTGKTAMMAHLADDLGYEQGEVLFVAPTNKAADVLRKKLRAAGQSSAVKTIHGYMYMKPEELHCETCRSGLDYPSECHVWGNRRAARICGCGVLDWSKRLATRFSLIVCDEASMVTRGLYLDLMEKEVPVLFVGDHGQLRPVETSRERADRNFSVMKESELNFKLETPHRQDSGSVILELAAGARVGHTIPYGEWDDSGCYPMTDPETGQPVFTAIQWERDPTSIIIAHKNETVQMWNSKLRKALGFRGVLEVGDRIVSETNIHRDRIWSGTMGTVTRVSEVSSRLPGGSNYRVTVEIDGEDRLWNGTISGDQLGAIEKVQFEKGVWRWNYAYCLTVHKAQGSEWRDVTVVDDFRNRGAAEYRNWLYTAITRASSVVTILR